LIKGEFPELSHIPKILENIIQNSKSIRYDTDSKSIIFTAPIEIEELMALDSVLKNPILILEKVSIDELNKVDYTSTIERINKEFGL